MSRVEPVDPRARLALVQWPPDAPRGAVTMFCAEHNISVIAAEQIDRIGDRVRNRQRTKSTRVDYFSTIVEYDRTLHW